MNVLVTGGAGFIGSHLAEALLAKGHRVAVLDDLSTGRYENIQHISSHPRFNFVKGSVLDETVLQRMVADADLVYHLAAAVGVDYVLGHMVETLEINARGTENVIKLAQRFGGKKVVVASSSEVYGKSTRLPYKEDDDLAIGSTTVGRWGYACSKIMDEFVALAYHKEMGLPAVILRLFNTVGPRQSGRYGMVLPRFVAQALEGNPITIHGDGNQTRCFTYVGDAVNAMVDIAVVPSAEGQVFNVGTGLETSINDLAVLVKETLNSTSEIIHIPYREAHGADFEDIPRRIPDISKIGRFIEYRPDTQLARIIKEVAYDLENTKASIPKVTGC